MAVGTVSISSSVAVCKKITSLLRRLVPFHASAQFLYCPNQGLLGCCVGAWWLRPSRVFLRCELPAQGNKCRDAQQRQQQTYAEYHVAAALQKTGAEIHGE